MGIATVSDFYAHGLPPSSLVATPRTISAVSASADTLTIPNHALADNTPFRFESTGVLPAPLAAGVVYYVYLVPDSDDLIKVRAAPGGAAIDLTTEGGADAVHSVVVQLRAVLEAVLDATSSRYVQDATAHEGPITRANAPDHFIASICHEAAADFMISAGLQRAGFADPQIQARAQHARDQRARWRDGAPIRGLTDATPGVADNQTITIVPAGGGGDVDWLNLANGGVL